ncbi:MAG: CDP-archaeol synthase [Vicinamibacterales bacterium]
MTAVDPVAGAGVLIAAFVLAGLAQTGWFAWSGSLRFAIPLDGGLEWRGRRLLGDHKTVRGLLVMIPAAATTLPMVAAIVQRVAPGSLWPLSTAGYAALGAWCAAGFMLGELPNSFVKRRLGVAPGAAAVGRGRPWQLTVDRLDSGLGLLVAASLVVNVPWQTWLLVLSTGPLFHFGFSVAMFRLGLKPRAA